MPKPETGNTNAVMTEQGPYGEIRVTNEVMQPEPEPNPTPKVEQLVGENEQINYIRNLDNLIQIHMLSKGYSFDSTYADSAQAGEVRIKSEQEVELLKDDPKQMEEMYRLAEENLLLNERFPQLDLKDPKQVMYYGKRAAAFWSLLVNFNQNEKSRASQFRNLNPDMALTFNKSLSNMAAFYEKTENMSEHEIEEALERDPSMSTLLTDACAGRRLLEEYESRIKDKAYMSTWMNRSADEMNQLFVESHYMSSIALAERKNPRVLIDYLKNGGEKFPYFMDKQGKIQVKASQDKRGALAPDLRKYQEAIEAGNLSEVFDRILSEAPQEEFIDGEPDYKRIYIDGKNAFEEYQETYGDDAEQIKKQIMSDLMTGSHRVELARVEDMGEGVPPRISFLPLRPDLSYVDETQKKRWYQSSRVKVQKEKWEKDPDVAKRRQEMEKNASERYVMHQYARLSKRDAYVDKWRESMNERISDLASPRIMEAKAKMEAEPELVREWISLKNEAFESVRVTDVLQSFENMLDPDKDLISAIDKFNENQKIGMAGKEFAGREEFQMLSRVAVDMIGLDNSDKSHEKYLDSTDEEIRQFAHSIDELKKNEELSDEQRMEQRKNLNAEIAARMRERMEPVFRDMYETFKKDEYMQMVTRFTSDSSRRERLRELDKHFMGISLPPNPTPLERFHYLEQEQSFLEARNLFSGVDLRNDVVADLYEDGDTLADKRLKLQAVERLYKEQGLTEDDMEAYRNSLPAEGKKDFDKKYQWAKDFMEQTLDDSANMYDGYVKDYLTYQAEAIRHKAGFVERDMYSLQKVIDDSIEQIEPELQEDINTICEAAVKEQEGEKVKENFQQMFGKTFQDFRDEHTATANFSAQFARPTTGVGIVIGLLLKDGHKVTDINDPTKLLDEKREAAKRLEKAIEVLDTPEDVKLPDDGREEEIGKVLADSTKGFCYLDLSKVVEDVTGRKIETKEDLKAAFASHVDMPKVAAAIVMIASGCREVHQSVVSLQKFNVEIDKQPSDEEFQKMMAWKKTMTEEEKEKRMVPARIYSAYLDNMSNEDLKRRSNLAQSYAAMRAERALDKVVESYAEGKSISDVEKFQSRWIMSEILQEAAEKTNVSDGKLLWGDVEASRTFYSNYAKEIAQCFESGAERETNVRKAEAFSDCVLNDRGLTAIREKLLPLDKRMVMRREAQEKDMRERRNNWISAEEYFEENGGPSRVTAEQRTEKRRLALAEQRGAATKAPARKTSFSKLCAGTETVKPHDRSNTANQKSSTKGLDSKTSAIKSPEVSVRRK